MPSLIHETVVDGLEELIIRAIHGTERRQPRHPSRAWKGVTRQLRRMYKGRSATIELCGRGGGESVRRCPDATFYHPDQPHLPSLVLEVAYSQSHQEVDQLARSYLLDSARAIRSVIGVDLPFPLLSGSVATISVWRLESDGTISRLDRPFDFGCPAFTRSNDTVKLYVADLLPLTTAATEDSPVPMTVGFDVAAAVAVVQDVADRSREVGPTIRRPSDAPRVYRKQIITVYRGQQSGRKTLPQRRMTDYFRVLKPPRGCHRKLPAKKR